MCQECFCVKIGLHFVCLVICFPVLPTTERSAQLTRLWQRPWFLFLVGSELKARAGLSGKQGILRPTNVGQLSAKCGVQRSSFKVCGSARVSRRHSGFFRMSSAASQCVDAKLARPPPGAGAWRGRSSSRQRLRAAAAAAAAAAEEGRNGDDDARPERRGGRPAANAAAARLHDASVGMHPLLQLVLVLAAFTFLMLVLQTPDIRARVPLPGASAGARDRPIPRVVAVAVVALVAVDVVVTAVVDIAVAVAVIIFVAVVVVLSPLLRCGRWPARRVRAFSLFRSFLYYLRPGY